MSFFKNNRHYLIIIILGCALSAAGGYYWYHKPRMYDFVDKRDRAFILHIFKENWYWLVGEGSDFDPAYMMDHMASSKKPHHKNNQHIRVMYVGNTPVGFTAYYKKKFYQGILHFVVIDKPYRAKGYGEFMVRDAIRNMIALGCTEIILHVRTGNEKARKLYERVGFKFYKDLGGGFLDYKYDA